MATLIFYKERTIDDGHGVRTLNLVKGKHEGDTRYVDYIGELLKDLNLSTAKSLLGKLRDAETYRTSEINFTPEDWGVKISKDGVKIRHDFVGEMQNEGSGSFTLNEFKTALAEWIKFVDHGPSQMVEVEL